MSHLPQGLFASARGPSLELITKPGKITRPRKKGAAGELSYRKQSLSKKATADCPTWKVTAEYLHSHPDPDRRPPLGIKPDELDHRLLEMAQLRGVVVCVPLEKLPPQPQKIQKHRVNVISRGFLANPPFPFGLCHPPWACWSSRRG